MTHDSAAESPAGRRDYPDEFLAALDAVTNKRARVVIDHILKHGFITTEQIKDDYGYDHPPRAVADVRDEGIPLERFNVSNSQGRRIAAYRFGDPATLRVGLAGGRKQLPKKLKTALLRRDGNRCAVCGQAFEAVYLQVDHRVPFRVAGEADTNQLDEWMLLCAACNRAKSWSCENCANWQERRDPALCRTCYWGNPLSYSHTALRPIRRLDVVWSADEVATYDALRQRAQQNTQTMPEFVKAVLRRHLGDDV